MADISTVEKLAFKLTTKERATLASKLLRTLPEFKRDDDDGVAEATRRYEELVANPEIGISFEELRTRVSSNKSSSLNEQSTL